MVLFHVDNQELWELKKGLNDAVNDGIGRALGAGMREAVIRLDIQVRMTEVMDGTELMLAPAFEWRTSVRIGKSWSAGEGKALGHTGVKEDEEGYQRAVHLERPEQPAEERRIKVGRGKAKTPPVQCEHPGWKGVDGMMVCVQCGMVRLPKEWEDAGELPILKAGAGEHNMTDADQVTPRMEGTGTDF